MIKGKKRVVAITGGTRGIGQAIAVQPAHARDRHHRPDGGGGEADS